MTIFGRRIGSDRSLLQKYCLYSRSAINSKLLHRCSPVTYYSRANAPTGSAGEESVSSCWVAVGVFFFLVVVAARCFVRTHAGRVSSLLLLLLLLHGVLLAQAARQTRPQILTHLARAHANFELAVATLLSLRAGRTFETVVKL